jgi:hypothetical protein
MLRGLLLVASLGLLGTALGCKMHGVCDCYTHPIGTATPAAYTGNPVPPPAGIPGPVPNGTALKPVPAQ